MSDVLEDSIRRHAEILKQDQPNRQQLRDFSSLVKKLIDRQAKHQIGRELSRGRFFRLLTKAEEMEKEDVVKRAMDRAQRNADLIPLPPSPNAIAIELGGEGS